MHALEGEVFVNKNKKHVLLKRALSIIVVTVLIVTVFVLREREKKKFVFTDFSDTTTREMLEIKRFYEFVPEMISHGEVFDVKFVVNDVKPPYNLEGIFDRSGVYLSIVKKVTNDFRYGVEIEYYSNNKNIITNRFDDLYFESYFPATPFAVAEGNKYITSSVLINLYDFDRKLPGVWVDRVVITFRYNDAEETHYLDYSEGNTDKLISLVIEEYFDDYEEYERANDSDAADNHYRYVRDHLSPYIKSMLRNDFGKWYDYISVLKSSYEKDPNSIRGKTLSTFSSVLFQYGEDIWFLSDKDLEKFNKLEEWWLCQVKQLGKC